MCNTYLKHVYAFYDSRLIAYKAKHLMSITDNFTNAAEECTKVTFYN